jgi:hypothetical protein
MDDFDEEMVCKMRMHAVALICFAHAVDMAGLRWCSC